MIKNTIPEYDSQTDITEGEFHRFCRVQRSGTVNMVSSDARTLACLDKKAHESILNNYARLEGLYGQPKA